MNADHYHYRLAWSEDDQEHVGLCAEFPSLSYLSRDPDEARAGIRDIVAWALEDMTQDNERVPEPLADAAD